MSLRDRSERLRISRRGTETKKYSLKLWLEKQLFLILNLRRRRILDEKLSNCRLTTKRTEKTKRERRRRSKDSLSSNNASRQQKKTRDDS